MAIGDLRHVIIIGLYAIAIIVKSIGESIGITIQFEKSINIGTIVWIRPNSLWAAGYDQWMYEYVVSIIVQTSYLRKKTNVFRTWRRRLIRTWVICCLDPPATFGISSLQCVLMSLTGMFTITLYSARWGQVITSLMKPQYTAPSFNPLNAHMYVQFGCQLPNVVPRPFFDGFLLVWNFQFSYRFLLSKFHLKRSTRLQTCRVSRNYS